MNQEYVSLLHLVDVRVAFFNGHAESRDEVPLGELRRLLEDCVLPERVDAVYENLLGQLRGITDHRGETRADFVEVVRDGDDPATAYARVNPDATSSYPSPDGRTLTVPGVIVGAEQHVLRTDGVVVEAFLGEGNGLDTYSTGLQEQEVRAKEAANQLRELEAERLRLALKIVSDNDEQRMRLYQQMFVRPQIVDRMDHARGDGNAGRRHTGRRRRRRHPEWDGRHPCSMKPRGIRGPIGRCGRRRCCRVRRGRGEGARPRCPGRRGQGPGGRFAPRSRHHGDQSRCRGAVRRDPERRRRSVDGGRGDPDPGTAGLRSGMGPGGSAGLLDVPGRRSLQSPRPCRGQLSLQVE